MVEDLKTAIKDSLNEVNQNGRRHQNSIGKTKTDGEWGVGWVMHTEDF